MEIRRDVFNQLIESDHCFNCGERTDFVKDHHSFLPGIEQKTCPQCGMGFRTNYIESDNDIVKLPDNFSHPEICVLP